MAKYLASAFTGVVVLLAHYELQPLYYDYVDLLKSLGLDVLHIPTPDRYPVGLLDISRASAFIDRHVNSGGSVLVQCRGGVGRSGLVTASYLVYEGHDPYTALTRVRSRVPGAVENKWQVQLLEDYYALTKLTRREVLTEFTKAAEKLLAVDEATYRHLSKVVQFTIELLGALNSSNLNPEDEALESMLHAHTAGARRLLESAVGCRSPGSQSPLVELAHALDYKMDSRVVVLDAVTSAKRHHITLLCSGPCEDIATYAQRASSRISELIAGELVFEWGNYLDYV